MFRSVMLILISLFTFAAPVDQLPVYVPHRLRPVPWPPGSPTPEFHSEDRTGAVTNLGARSIGILRFPTAWGTGVIDEWFMVLGISNRITLDSLRELGWRAGDSLWAARSYYNESDALSPVRFTVAACLLIADDSLVAYGVIADTNAYAREFMAREQLVESGYYGLASGGRRLKKVANTAPGFESRCREQLQIEGRGLGAP
jgi:hypothetical protein